MADEICEDYTLIHIPPKKRITKNNKIDENVEFLWCVITVAEDKPGNQYNEMVMDEDNPDQFRIDERTGQPMSIKVQNFVSGEILAVDPHYLREISGHGRKPHRWNVEYMLFQPGEYQMAVNLAKKVRGW